MWPVLVCLRKEPWGGKEPWEGTLGGHLGNMHDCRWGTRHQANLQCEWRQGQGQGQGQGLLVRSHFSRPGSARALLEVRFQLNLRIRLSSILITCICWS